MLLQQEGEPNRMTTKNETKWSDLYICIRSSNPKRIRLLLWTEHKNMGKLGLIEIARASSVVQRTCPFRFAYVDEDEDAEADL